MSKEVTVEELIANIAAHVAEVKNGETLTVVEDGQTVAMITPSMVKRGAVPYPFRNIDFGPPVKLPFDAADLIIDEREYERSGKKYGV